MMMKKIKLRNGLSPTNANAILFTILAIPLIGLFLFFLTLEDFSIANAFPIIFILIIIIVCIVLNWRESLSSDEEYVSEFIITNDNLVLVYKNEDDTRNVEIKLDNIKNFHIKLIIDRYRSYSVPCTGQQVLAEVKIGTKDNEIINFNENLSSGFSLCNYKFMLELLDIAEKLPNFSYEVSGNFIGAQADINHYAKFKKRLPFIQRELIIPYKNAQAPQKRLALGIFIVWLILSSMIFIFLF